MPPWLSWKYCLRDLSVNRWNVSIVLTHYTTTDREAQEEGREITMALPEARFPWSPLPSRALLSSWMKQWSGCKRSYNAQKGAIGRKCQPHVDWRSTGLEVSSHSAFFFPLLWKLYFFFSPTALFSAVLLIPWSFSTFKHMWAMPRGSEHCHPARWQDKPTGPFAQLPLYSSSWCLPRAGSKQRGYTEIPQGRKGRPGFLLT